MFNCHTTIKSLNIGKKKYQKYVGMQKQRSKQKTKIGEDVSLYSAYKYVWGVWVWVC